MFRFLRDYLLIKSSGYFNDRFYLLNNPDVRQADISPLKHYVQHGWKEGRQPCVQFDEIINTFSGEIVENANPLVQFLVIKRKEKISSWHRLISIPKKFVKGFIYIIKLRGTVIFGGYPYPERERDGYYQRIRSIDNILSRRWRIYIDAVNLQGRDQWYDIPNEKVLILRPNRVDKSNRLAKFATLLCILRCRTLYFHSILSIPNIDLIWKLPGLTKILDFHGVVPEEFQLQGDISSSDYYAGIEKKTIKHVNYCVVVSDTMRKHILTKYSNDIKCRFITLPIYKKLSVDKDKEVNHTKKPLIIYVGGLQEWQQIPKMVDVICESIDFADFIILCPEPRKFLEMFPDSVKNNPSLVVDSKPFLEIVEIYKKSIYGFILRKDVIVNNVACPTKLIEYLALGVIPIVDSENIGDFKNLGMKYVKYIVY